MEIVSYGHIRPREIFCSGCGATLRYLPKDVKSKPNWPEKTYINCPICGSPIFVNVKLTKNDKYITFADGGGKEEDDLTVKIKDLSFMQADMKTMAHNEVHDDDAHVAWQSGYLACLRAVQKQILEAAGIERKEVKND